jgi:hypothetical protein
MSAVTDTIRNGAIRARKRGCPEDKAHDGAVARCAARASDVASSRTRSKEREMTTPSDIARCAQRRGPRSTSPA